MEMDRRKKDYRRHRDFDKKFNENLKMIQKVIVDAKIVGDTLSMARLKIDANNIIIRPYEIGGVNLEDYRSNRCNVAMDGEIISKILSYG